MPAVPFSAMLVGHGYGKWEFLTCIVFYQGPKALCRLFASPLGSTCVGDVKLDVNFRFEAGFFHDICDIVLI
ncbi:hypothetical protein DPMN_100409 [Dreissena polymorpha]|uniref:Uncharacterized protein n=1 Tax=Dreissena polymorpha TaxID=45954 RepID=A0A9D4LHA2_DREPO|nr:hypothetical protein DPMN_100409 [Dreissena polymorpha]